MAKLEERAIDAGVAGLKTSDDAAAIEWWKQRLSLTAAVPGEIARAGAWLPQLRQLSRLPDADRRRLTQARMQALVSLPMDQRQRVLSATKLALAADPDLVKSDDALVQQLAPEVPGAADMQQTGA